MSRIVSLTSENVKRLVAVSIAPEGNVVVIGGANGAGKSSVLDSIAYALGGAGLIPAEPIRRGETHAKTEINLGDIIVTRKYRRSVASWGCDTPLHEKHGHAGAHDASCGPMFGETSSTLEITNKDGAVFKSPQSMLDKLIGKLSFDPLAFAHAKAAEQRETLRSLLGLDTSGLDQEKADALARKRRVETKITERTGQVKALPVHMNVPEEEISLEEISKSMLEAERLRTVAQDAQKTADRFEANITACDRTITDIDERIALLERSLDEAKKHRAQYADEKKRSEMNFADAKAALDQAVKAVPDVAELRKRIEETEETNRRVRSNANRRALEADVKNLEAERDKEHETAQTVEDAKRLLLEQAAYPVPGLGLNDNGVTWNGLPFEQASTAEQLRVSVAMGLSMNPTLKVLLIRDGSALDSKSLRLIAEMAEKADAQVWVERVAESKDGVTVMIEDGQQV